jgi:acetone carboxylase, gamma subunit
VKDIQSGFKDPDRFDKWLAVLQERVPYDDPIVLPAGEGLNIVARRLLRSASGGGGVPGDSELVIRCDCGHDFCRFDRNWKHKALILVRDDAESLREIYPKWAAPDPDWVELREFICPSCARLLETEAAPPGHPVVHEFLPDVEGFYRGWLRRAGPG